jgi:hypothetical protein
MANKGKFNFNDLFRQSGNKLLKSMLQTPGIKVAAEGVTEAQFAESAKQKSWKTKKLADRTIHTVVWRHVSGLEAEVEYIEHAADAIVEISGRVFNRGRRALKHVTGPGGPAFTLALNRNDNVRMTTVYGGTPTDGEYPPQGYRVMETDGVRFLYGGHEGGRSTDTEMPYAIITDSSESCGVFCALEWPCSWTFHVCNFFEAGKRHVPVQCHIACADLTLKPGQSLPIPRGHVGFFKGDAVAGSNALRRHIVDRLRPQTLPPVFYNHYFGLRRDWTVEDQIREANIYAELGIEYYVVDAEWFTGNFRDGIGNWEVEDKVRFPNGMAEFADHVRSLGMKFGSWLEIEWAMKGSHWGRKHSDWFDTAPGRFLHYGGEHHDMLLRVADPKVRSSVADFLEAWVNKYGIEWLRWDMNNAPAPIWRANDPKGQAGCRQIEYGEGVYALLDEFIRRCPQVHIEACASGGHRMDLGTLRRAHSAWMCDNTDTHNSIRRFQSGLNRVLPGCYGNSTFLSATYEHQRAQSLTSLKRDGYPPAPLRSRMGGSLGFTENSRFYTPAIKAQLRKEIATYKAQRHLLLKDYYPLFNPQRLSEYDGWQFHDPATGEGFIQIFRCDAPASSVLVDLPGLKPEDSYAFTDIDSGRTRAVVGGRPLKVSIAQPHGVKWYQYRPK